MSELVQWLKGVENPLASQGSRFDLCFRFGGCCRVIVHPVHQLAWTPFDTSSFVSTSFFLLLSFCLSYVLCSFVEECTQPSASVYFERGLFSAVVIVEYVWWRRVGADRCQAHNYFHVQIGVVPCVISMQR